jgi:hypothetical protein
MTRKPSKTSKAAHKKPTAKAKPSPASKSSRQAKAKAKKPEKLLLSKKAVPARPAPKAKPPKAAAPRPVPAKAAAKAIAKPAVKAVAKAAPKSKAAKAPAASGKKKPLVLPTGILKPGFGYKWACFNCGAKFYDLGKPVPVCPKCEADQRDRPPVVASAAPTTPQPKRPSMPPMSRFLDDDEVAAPEPDEFGAAPAADGDIEEPEAAEVDIEALDEPGGMAEGEFSEAEEE